jgi:hypothetical protein
MGVRELILFILFILSRGLIADLARFSVDAIAK